MKKFGLLIVAFFALISTNYAQTTLSAGDIAIVGFNFDNPDDFAFVTFVELEAGTIIRFTDCGWSSTNNAFRQNEGGVQFTAQNNIAPGTIVHFLSPVSSPWETNNFGLGGSFSLSEDGDQIIAFQGDASVPTIIYALNSDSTTWAPNATSANNSALPTGLVNGTTAIALNEVDNGYYSGGPHPNLNTLRGLIGNTSNWSVSNTIHYELETLLGGSLPVELTSFSAAVIGKDVKLNWNTATEINNFGFEIERKVGSSQSSVGNYEKIGFVNGNGNSNSPKSYSFVDDKVSTGKYSYRLKQIDNDGQFEYSKTIEVDVNGVKEYKLTQNYPNPFNPATTIQYILPQAGIVKLTLYNILGQEIRTLVNETKEAGTHTINIDASDLNSGMYIYKIESGSFVQTRKMTLVK